MEIVRILVICKKTLYTVQFEDAVADELSRIFDQWNDVAYLYGFFQEHIKDLQNGFYNEDAKPISIETAIRRTLDEAEALEQRLKFVGRGLKEGIYLKNYFKPLNNEDYRQKLLKKSKATGLSKKSWLRVYAISVPDDCFVISGGAIKLTPTMNTRFHLFKELNKLETTRNYLMDKGMLDRDDFEKLEL